MSQQINLLNPLLIKQRDWLNARMMALSVLAVTLLMCLMYFWMLYQDRQSVDEQRAVAARLSSLKDALTQAELSHTPRPPDKRLLERVTAAENALQARQQLIAYLQGGGAGAPGGFSGYMQAFSRQSARGIWLTGFLIDNAQRQIQISGRAMQPELVPQYIAGLGREPLLKGQAFADLNMATVEPAQPEASGEHNVVPTSPRFVEFRLKSSDVQGSTGAGGQHS
jgi:hypothetical protein